MSCSFHSHHLTCCLPTCLPSPQHVSCCFCSFLFPSVFVFSLLQEDVTVLIRLSASLSTLAPTPRRLHRCHEEKLLHPPSLLRLHPHFPLQVAAEYCPFLHSLAPTNLTFTSRVLAASHPSPSEVSHRSWALSGVVRLKIESRNTRISSSTHHQLTVA